MKLCHHCGQVLTRDDCHDLAVMRPVHKACYAERLAAPKRPTWGRLTVLAPMQRRMGVRLR